MKLLNSTQVAAKLGMTRGAFYNLKQRDASFPKPLNVQPKILRWDEQDINQWLNQKKESANGESVGV